MIGYALGSIAGGVVLARRPVRRKAIVSMAAWTLYLPAYGLFALAGSLWLAMLGAALAGISQSSALVLVNAAAQEEVPDRVLGRVSGLISLVHRGAHATGLLLVAPCSQSWRRRPCSPRPRSRSRSWGSPGSGSVEQSQLEHAD